MKMRTLRKLRAQAPRHLRRRSLAACDATIEPPPDPGPGPEVVFDRVTGPYGRRYPSAALGPGAFDEET
jgi:hypothetical protein